ncbi:hypothetical protein WR25_19978 [Diploscapter pachys]|uniref:RING-type domain-containing protein n=1 Tax=Diploscapter pachys TaxID=2018661 RepID=A0A2A2KVA6_9BILA|nr:hypothetical protein WR25_19978 [Diploscapter pachys]
MAIFDQNGVNVFCTGIPWSALCRHFSAFVLYGYALYQWPGNIVTHDWAGDDTVFAFSLTSLMFTMTMWSTMLFHYLVSAGRVEIDWTSGRVRAKGWMVKFSRRAHRVMLSLSLAISAMAIIQSTTTSMVITHFYLKTDQPPTNEQHLILIMLKVDQTLAFFLFVYVLGRLVFEPVSIRKRRTPVSGQNDGENGRRKEVTTRSGKFELPDFCDECSICIERWANRQLGCGHVICCCCLGEIWRTEMGGEMKCPFCRSPITVVRRLLITDGGNVERNDCCGTMLSLKVTPASSSDGVEWEELVERRQETQNRDRLSTVNEEESEDQPGTSHD